jgi:hypothetical protein
LKIVETRRGEEIVGTGGVLVCTLITAKGEEGVVVA